MALSMTARAREITVRVIKIYHTKFRSLKNLIKPAYYDENSSKMDNEKKLIRKLITG